MKIMWRNDGDGSPARVQPRASKTFQRAGADPGRSQDQAVGPDGRYRERSAALRADHEAAQPTLDRQIEALLCPAAEQTEPPSHDWAWDGRHPRVAGNPEKHPAGGQVLDHLVAEATLFKVPLQGLVAPAPGPFGICGLVDHLRDPDAEVKPQAEEPALQQHVAAGQVAAAAVDGAQDARFGELVLPD